jgi:lysylphosphatidylglycerol synthetase-like protein (DUF2156 family)
MTNWYSGIYKAFMLSSVISFLISFFTTGVNSYGSILTGYSTLVLAVSLILLLLFNNIFRVTQNNNSASVLTLLLVATGPFLLMLGILAILLYLTVKYKDIIINNNVSQSYNTFTNIGILLFLLQTSIVFTSLNSRDFELTGKLSKVTSGLLYLLGVLTLFSTWIVYITLKYYTTDGFTFAMV